jgi:hypothetical protein
MAGMTTSIAQSPDPLPSWNDGKAKQSIVDFVVNVTRQGSPDFVPAAERIATFDNDGTLWAEQPMYIQLLFGLDRIKELAPQHPEWNDKEPFKSVLAGDLKSAFAGGAPSLIELMALGHSNMTIEEFDRVLSKWLASAKHPTTGRSYTEMVYQPMVELLADLLQRVQDLHRFGRRSRFHARPCRKSSRHPARTGHRQRGQAQVRNARRQARALQVARS